MMARRHREISPAEIVWGSIALLGTAGLIWVVATSRFFTPNVRYTVRRREGPIEIRDYPDLAIAQTDGDAREQQAFNQLFRYISGNNSTRQKIPMTAPVLIEKRGTAPRMAFIMPDEVSPPPEPENARVEINVRPAVRMAALRYRGWPNQQNERQAIGVLRRWLLDRELPITAEPVIAYYDPPWMPPPLRRNEVLIPLPA